MLYGRGDQVPLFFLPPRRAFDGDIVCLRSPGSKKYFLAAGAQRQGCFLARLGNGRTGLPARGMHAGGVAKYTL